MRADRPSSTAKLIARCTLLAARDPSFQLLVPAADPARLAAVLDRCGPASWLDHAVRHPWTARWLWRAEGALLPGIIAHYLARKRWLEQRVAAALNHGCEQVVVLGAGFDTLAWRFHRAWPAVLFCELDHPATQRPKSAALAALPPDENFVLQPTDLGRELPTVALRRLARFDPHRDTCFVAEGLLMYLEESRVAELLRDIASLPSVMVAFTFMEPDADGRAAFRGNRTFINAWLRRQGEPFTWAIARAGLGDFLGRLGLRVQSLADAEELRAAILVPANLPHAALAEGECLCCATSLP